MYQKSGGCTVMKRCATCRHLGEDETAVGFGRKGSGSSSITYYCRKHPEKQRGWKPGDTACHYYGEAEVYQAYMESPDGQLSFL